ncbi:MAG: ATP-dependent helicase [Elainellaceae cyanobacterium]
MALSNASVDPNALGEAAARLRSQLRAGQKPMADWRGGTLAVSAVPGSGKSTGMAIAAALAIARNAQANPESGTPRQLLLVTFTRSAVASLKAKVRHYLQILSVPPVGFAVYTLHGLAYAIATRHPELSGIDPAHTRLSAPNQNHYLIRNAVERWIAASPASYRQLIEGQNFDGEETEGLRRQSVLRTDVLPRLAQVVIHEAKSSGLLPDDLRRMVAAQRCDPKIEAQAPYQFVEVAAGLYDQYQRLRRDRQLFDYDDIILAALKVLQDASARQLWQSQIYGIFEDEAQDSSPLQAALLDVLSRGSSGESSESNYRGPDLVRVGDPNQAINSTFTPADPIFFRRFCEQCASEGSLTEMTQAGRSTPIILQAANFLVDWANRTYPSELPFRPQRIQPVPKGDPQPEANPPPVLGGLEIYRPETIYDALERMAAIASEQLTQQGSWRAAVLVRQNRQAAFVAQVLRNPQTYGLSTDLIGQGIAIYDAGDRQRRSAVPQEMLALLRFLERPHSSDHLTAALSLLAQRRLIPTLAVDQLAALPEQFLYPSPLKAAPPAAVARAQRYCASLLRAQLELPTYQLIPFLALALHYSPADLATADKLAARLAQIEAPSLVERLEGLIDAEDFEPVEVDDLDAMYRRPRQITIMTMHRAKGLDWDLVFLPLLHEKTLPGQSWVPAQLRFLGQLNPAEAARAQLRAIAHQQSKIPDLGQAWREAAAQKVSEEYRLLYVAMTRARRLLWLSAAQSAPFNWKRPEHLEQQRPCPAIAALEQRFFNPSQSPIEPGSRSS